MTVKYLFSSEGKKLLQALSFTETLYAFDFDGTLAPIVNDPQKAGPALEVKKLLLQFKQDNQVAIISGRATNDLKQRLDVPVENLIGNHGLESQNNRPDVATNAEEVCSAWYAQLQTKMQLPNQDPAVWIENKTYTLAIHYRNSRNKKICKDMILSWERELSPRPRVIMGKCVVNLVSAGAPHKGVALLELMFYLNLQCAFYIGDDDTDEDVFSLPNARIISVRVGKKKNSQAQFFIKKQSEINDLLKTLVELNDQK